MDRRRYVSLSTALLAGAIAGCTSAEEPAGSIDASDPSTPGTAPDVADGALADLVTEANAFAFELFAELRSADDAGNLMVSPISATTALAMTYAGAGGTTREQMREALRYTLDDEQLHAAFNDLQRTLDERGEDVDADDRPSEYGGDDDPVPFQLSMVNAVWGQEGFPFRETYLQTLEDHYGGGLNEVDFGRDPSGVREAINDWVAEQTEDRIAELLPPGAIEPATVLVLTNAIYFAANWRDPFDDASTRPAEFTALDGSTSEVQTMSQKTTVPATTVDGARAAELPYVGGDVGMLVVVPPAGEFEAYERSFDAQRLRRIVDGLEERRGYVRLPRFAFESAFELEEPLEALGMTAAFSESDAEFSRMAALGEVGGTLFVDEVYHDTYVAVDERGTEAAAATGSTIVATSAPPTLLEANRPFLFVIRDRPTGTVLFTGRVVDAAAARE